MAVEEITRPALVARPAEDTLYLQWTPVIAGAFGAAALSFDSHVYTRSVSSLVTCARRPSSVASCC